MSFQLLVPAGLSAATSEDGARVFNGRAEEGSRDVGGPPTTILCEDDTIIGLTWEDGTELLVRGDDLRSRGQTRGDAVLIPGLSSTRDGLAPRLVNLAVGVLAPIAARAVARKVDAIGTDNDEGFCRITADGRIHKLRKGKDDRLTPTDWGARGDLLLLIHGTFTSTEQTFDKLVDPRSPQWGALMHTGTFGEAAWGYDHPTLSADPVQNARNLVAGLPDGARLHLVSHSRGGLVADVLSAACGAQPPELAIEDLTGDDDQRARVRELHAGFLELHEQCRTKGLTVQHSVRSGTPAQGTTLASERLDVWLNVMLNALGLVPALRGNPIYGAVKTLIAAVLKERARDDIMPGIAAMIPERAFVRWLATLRADDLLTVIASDMEHPGHLGRLIAVLGDVYFRQANDLVVDTASMVGGVVRRVGHDRAPFGGAENSRLHVHHLGYFSDNEVRDEILRTLTALPDQLFTSTQLRGAGTRAGGERGAWGYLKDALASDGAITPEPPKPEKLQGGVIVVPGIMGSVLEVDDEPIWPHLDRLALGGLDRLDPDKRRDVSATHLLAGPYQRLLRYLHGANFSAYPFPYDWRLSLRTSAEALAFRIKELLGDPSLQGKPLHILAHSMGGLVARGVMAWHRDVWRAFRDREGRLVMLGTPNHGSWAVPRLLHGEDGLLGKLATLDVKHGRRELIDMISRFQGFLEMLPASPDRPLDDEPLLHPAWWEAAQVNLGERLADVRAVRQNLLGAVDPGGMIYVAGRAPETPCGAVQGEKGRVFQCSADGDGEVLWTHGELPGVPTYVMSVVHGDMADRPWTFDALKDLLVWGTTTRLLALPRTRAASHARDMKPAEPTLRPDVAELTTEALGASSTWGAVEQRLELKAVHGDLVFEEGVAVVGHPEGDRLRGAEPSLDLVYQGELRARLAAGRYPQRPPQVAVLPSPARRDAFPYPPVVVIVGLGAAVELTRARLVEILCDAFVELGLPPNERLLPPNEGGRILSVAAPGCVELGLPVDESVSATIEAALLANRKLAALGQRDPTRAAPLICGLRFVFTYGDQAAEAARVMWRWQIAPALELLPGETIEARRIVETRRVAERAPPARPLRARPQIRSRRIAAVTDRHTLKASVTGDTREPETVEYLLPGDGSAGLRRTQQVRWATVTGLSRALTGALGLVPSEIAALRAHLMPRVIADQFETGLDLQIAVDRWTAGIPWEAFVSAGVDESAVLSGRIAVLRQYEHTTPMVPRDPPARGNALLVCSPGGFGGWAHLDGAVIEADAVRQALKGAQYAVQETGDDPIAIRAQLARPFEIVHLIGHGQFTPGVAGATGLVAAGGDFISRLDLGPFERRPPALVFLNCCHLGRMDTSLSVDDAPGFAADLATGLIEAGVSAVIAAGWAVNDDAATAFAGELYRLLLSGQRLRHAVAGARLAAHARAPNATTWAAYQCYGDPNFVLPSAIAAQPTVDQELDDLLSSDDYVSPVEIEGLLDQVLVRLIYGQNDHALALRMVRATYEFFERLHPDLRSPEARYRMGRLLRQVRDVGLNEQGRNLLKQAASDIASQLHGLPEPLRPTEPTIDRAGPGPALPLPPLDAAEVERLMAAQGALELLLRSQAAPPSGARREAIEEANAVTRTYVSAALDRGDSSADAVAAVWKRALPPGTEPVTMEEAGFWLWTVLRALRDDRPGALSPEAHTRRQQAGDALLDALQRAMPQLLHDPNAGQFGHRAARDGARVHTRREGATEAPESGPSPRRAWLISAEIGLPAAAVEAGATVELHLYPRYESAVRRIAVPAGLNAVKVTFDAYGSFTIGVVILRPGAEPVQLEQDLGYTEGLEADVEFLRR